MKPTRLFGLIACANGCGRFIPASEAQARDGHHSPVECRTCREDSQRRAWHEEQRSNSTDGVKQLGVF